MKVVVTGATGFVGSRVVRALRARGIEHVAVSRRVLPDAVQVADYGDAPDGDVLVHLAEHADRRRATEAGSVYEAQSAATLSALTKKGYRRIIYASSAALYGDQHTRPCRPDDPVVADDVYARVKRAGEMAVLSSGGVVARLSNMYGPGMSGTNVVSAIQRQIPGTGPLRVADEAPVRDFLWVDDAAAALVAMIRAEQSGVYNVGTGHGSSVRDLASTALALAGESRRPIVSTAPSGRRSYLVLDIDATTESLAWRPDMSLRAGLRELVSSSSPV